MAKTFSVELSMREAPTQAQARASGALAEPARTVGLRLAASKPGTLSYRPRVQFPFLLMLWHTINGERMTVQFEPAPDGGSRVSISGAVTGAREPLAADPEHWSGPLGATPGGA
jgi:hypothetical protein